MINSELVLRALTYTYEEEWGSLGSSMRGPELKEYRILEVEGCFRPKELGA